MLEAKIGLCCCYEAKPEAIGILTCNKIVIIDLIFIIGGRSKFHKISFQYEKL